MIVYMISSTPLHSQNVGVETTAPDASALLVVDASYKRLIVSRVALTSSNDAATIPSPAA